MNDTIQNSFQPSEKQHQSSQVTLGYLNWHEPQVFEQLNLSF